MLYFSIQNRVRGRTGKVSEAAGARWRFHARIVVGLSSDCRRTVVESSFYWRKQFTEFPLKSWTYRFRGRRSIWWGWWLTVHAPRIVNDVSCVTRINHGIHFAWQAQYLLRLEVDFACSAHWKWRFIWGADQSWDSILRGRRSICWGSRLTLLAPRILNDVSYVTRINHEMHFAWQAQYLLKLECDFSWQAQHLVTFWEIAGARNVVFFNSKSSPRSDESGLRSGGCEMTILSSDHGRIMVGLSSDYPRIVFILVEAIQRVSAAILNLKISWQAQYLLRFEVDFACSAHSKWRFICDADQSWDAFCVAGAGFAEVRGWLCLLRAF